MTGQIVQYKPAANLPGDEPVMNLDNASTTQRKSQRTSTSPSPIPAVIRSVDCPLVIPLALMGLRGSVAGTMRTCWSGLPSNLQPRKYIMYLPRDQDQSTTTSSDPT
jgi:hypothetical protein